MAIKYQQTWGWNLMNINRAGIWRWHITLPFDSRYNLYRRIIKPNSFWMLAHNLFCFRNYPKKYEIIPSHRIYSIFPRTIHLMYYSYSSMTRLYFESLKYAKKKATWAYASTHTKNTLPPVLLATVLLILIYIVNCNWVDTRCQYTFTRNT
jgi:hypothetical protein